MTIWYTFFTIWYAFLFLKKHTILLNAYTCCRSWKLHCMKCSLISDCKWFHFVNFSLIGLLFVYIYHKIKFHYMKYSLIGYNSENSESIMQWKISWSTVVTTGLQVQPCSWPCKLSKQGKPLIEPQFSAVCQVNDGSLSPCTCQFGPDRCHLGGACVTYSLYITERVDPCIFPGACKIISELVITTGQTIELVRGWNV